MCGGVAEAYIYLWLWEWKISVFTWESAWHTMKYICTLLHLHNDSIKWKHCLHYWPFVQGIHQSLVNSLHKGKWHGALMFSLICAWINSWASNGDAGDLRHHHAHYDLINKRCLCINEGARDRLNLARNWFVWIMLFVIGRHRCHESTENALV